MLGKAHCTGGQLKLGINHPSATAAPHDSMVRGIYFWDFIEGLIARVQLYSKILPSQGFFLIPVLQEEKLGLGTHVPHPKGKGGSVLGKNWDYHPGPLAWFCRADQKSLQSYSLASARSSGSSTCPGGGEAEDGLMHEAHGKIVHKAHPQHQGRHF